MWDAILTAVFILALVIANGLFAAAEIAIVSARRSRIRQLAEEGVKSARKVERLRADAEGFLATVQVGITLVGALAAAVGGAQLAGPIAQALRALPGRVLERFADELALGLVVAFYSYLSVVLGELVPKSIALRHAERFALRLSGLLLALRWLARPLVWLLTASANLVLKPMHDRTSFGEARLTPEELMVLVEDAARSGSLEPRRAEIIGRAVEFGELTAADVLVPRSRIVAIERHASTDEIRRILLEEGHNRIPVYEGSLDTVIGYITAHDIISLIWEKELVVLEDIIRPAFFVPQTMRAVDLLRALQRRHEHLAIVVDEYGGTAGLCTTEDLVEEIVGEIFSEDAEEPELIQKQPDGSALVAAVLPVREFNRAFDADVPEDDGYDTVGGLLTHLAGAIPLEGQTFESHGFEFAVVARSERKVDQVRVRRREPPPDEEPE